MSFTQVLYEKKEKQVVEAKRQQAGKPSTSGTQTHIDALCDSYADLCFFDFQEGQKDVGSYESKNQNCLEPEHWA